MDRKADLKRQYKENPPQAGVYKITNTTNGKVLLGKGMNVEGVLNRQKAQLRWGSHPRAGLQEDWKRLGQESFTFEVVDYLEAAKDPAQDAEKDLDGLFKLWLDKLEPFGERGYNEPAKE